MPTLDARALVGNRHSGEDREINGAEVGNVCERKPVARHKRIGGQLLFDPVVVAAHAPLATLNQRRNLLLRKIRLQLEPGAQPTAFV